MRNIPDIYLHEGLCPAPDKNIELHIVPVNYRVKNDYINHIKEAERNTFEQAKKCKRVEHINQEPARKLF